ncbi:minor tail protein [Synechococcus phage S-CBS4]|uniref:minor tail protein n=1 Tax=Synechococcus phage S-CBS4 TaxID=756275 RepID=UPI000246A6FC|nr:minor tail protein [Synechococcus phage S-CBS4]AEX56003.1 phage tail protein [Synechococcus phage S-CBS4]
MTIQQDVSQTWHDAIIELFELDLSTITGTASDKYYFTANLMPDNTKISWKGITYEPLPIEAGGFERTTKGQIPQPELTVANVLGTLASVVNTLDDLVGAKVTRRRTLMKYLDGGSSPDSTQEFPDDTFYIERKIAESSVTITWQLASKIDLEGLQLPKRIITQNYCLWKYRGAECGYDGPAIANEFDQPITAGGSSSAEGAAYLAAYETFDAAKGKLANAETKLNNLLGQKEAACDPEVADTEQVLFVFKDDPFNDYSFVIQDGDGNTIVAIWKGAGVSVTGDQPLYRPDFKQKTNRGPGNGKNGTGPTFAIDQYVPTQGGGLQKSTLPVSTSSFAIKDADGEPILIINGSIQPVRLPGQPGYDIGFQSGAGFAPMRSIAKLNYDNAACKSITTKYDNAKDAYDDALAEYNAALAAVEAAYAALPADDSVKKNDKCGKRLQSCRLRFGIKGALPFGGFPAANVTR